MRFSVSEKYEIIRLVETSELGVNRTLQELKIPKSTFYKWYNCYLEDGIAGLEAKPRARRTYWNKIPDEVRQQVVDLALDYPEESPRSLACKLIDEQHYFISESSVYRILKAQGLITSPAFSVDMAADAYKNKTTRVHQMWQTDFTYLKIVNWGWYYLSTILDDYSRYIVYWELCSTMTAGDVERSIQRALQKTGLTRKQRPRLLSDNGPCYISSELKAFIEAENIDHIRGRPCHPQTQGKIERYHRSMKSIIKLDNYYFPEELKIRLSEFVNYYNNRRYHESLNNLRPADVYLGRGAQILKQRQITKEKTMQLRRKNYLIQTQKSVT